MASQFISRIVNYVANEILIKGLANSRTFQKFALRTDANIREVNKMSNEAIDQVIQKAAEAAKVTANAASGSSSTSMPRPQRPLRGFPGFVSAFMKEIQKDLGMIKK